MSSLANFSIDQMPVGVSVLDTLVLRLAAEPFLGLATILFLCAVVHTFICPLITSYAHTLAPRKPYLARFLELWGEVEFVFILWAIPLFSCFAMLKGFRPAVHYFGNVINYKEPLFVIAIIALAATKPILIFSERVLGVIARAFGDGVSGWWKTLLIFGPIMGSLITEPAAMTITALLLGQKFYASKPSAGLAYVTLALLFVNISIGGVLTHFAAPAVVMVAERWGFDTPYMFTHFGLNAILAIVVNTLLVRIFYRKEFRRLKLVSIEPSQKAPMPLWVTIVQITLLVWAVVVSHYPPLLAFALLVGVWFAAFTREYQEPVQLLGALKVGVFLAGLVIFGSFQQWWVEPLIRDMHPWVLFSGALALSPFNDNAAITYLASLVPNLTEPMKFAIMAGAVSGGGLTIIANAPNPAGFGILRKYFPREIINPFTLFVAALLPTLIIAWAFMGMPPVQQLFK